MAGPLNGISGQQQFSVSQALQPGAQNNSQQVREREDAQPQESTVQPQNAAAAESQGTETESQDILQSQISEALAAQEESSEPAERGSLLDIQV